MPLQFPQPFRHDHPPVSNVNALFAGRLTVAQRTADRVANFVGSWSFIVGQTVLLAIWAIVNVTAWLRHWDPYPFILMNLFLSVLAAYTAPLIMMSQNRQSAKDRLESHHNYLVNQKAETEIRAVLEHLAAQDRALLEIHELLERQSAAAPGSKR